jgi:hypothetical protein
MLHMYVNLTQYKDVFIYLYFWVLNLLFIFVILASYSSLFVVSYKGIGETHYEQV